MTPSLPKLTIDKLRAEAKLFADAQSRKSEPSLYGITDGKAVGTFLEHRFREHLQSAYDFKAGNSAEGIDFPKLKVDMKVTSIKQPQSSCPFKSARQKVYGLGYSLLVFAYEKSEDRTKKTARLNIRHVIFVQSKQTADFQTTSGILKILDNDGNRDDLLAFFEERNLPIDEVQASQLADEILEKRPVLGYLTISNALQWRLQYARAIEKAGKVAGITRLR